MVQRHQKETCDGADIRSCRVTIRGQAENAVVTTNGDTTTINSAINNNTLTNNTINMTVNVVPARWDEEDDAVVQALFRNRRALRLILLDDLEDAVPSMFRYTHGDAGPPELQNVHIGERYVTQLQNDGPGKTLVKTPLHKFTGEQAHRCQKNLEAVAEEAACSGDATLMDQAEKVREALTKTIKTRKRENLTPLEVSKLYSEDNKEFQQVVKEVDKRPHLNLVKKLKEEIVSTAQSATKLHDLQKQAVVFGR